MKSDWEDAISFVLKMEGGSTVENDPNDPGGMTRFGISKKSYPELDIANLTLDQAKDIYRRDYWNVIHGDELPRRWAFAALDMAVNMGTGSAIRKMQEALGIDVDGVIGAKTISAAYEASSRRVMKFLALRQAEYALRISVNPRLIIYAVNWSFRVLSLFEAMQPKLEMA